MECLVGGWGQLAGLGKASAGSWGPTTIDRPTGLERSHGKAQLARCQALGECQQRPGPMQINNEHISFAVHVSRKLSPLFGVFQMNIMN